MYEYYGPPAILDAMGYLNDKDAYILANTYGFNPPKKIGPARLRIQNTGKYEPDATALAETRTILLASFVDATNILIRYKPAELIP